MTSPLEVEREQRQVKKRERLGAIIDIGLESASQRSGVVLTGLTLKIRRDDCLLVLKAVLEGRPSVAFVGSSDIAGCFLKAYKELGSDKVSWRDDKFVSS